MTIMWYDVSFSQNNINCDPLLDHFNQAVLRINNPLTYISSMNHTFHQQLLSFSQI